MPDAKMRIGLIGTGLRVQKHIDILQHLNDVELVAICDINERMLGMAKAIITKSSNKEPTIYTGNNYAWQTMLKKENLDAVIIATPWKWHKPMIIGALESGIKYVGT